MSKKIDEQNRVKYNKALIRFNKAVEFYNDPKSSDIKKKQNWPLLSKIMADMDSAAKALDINYESQDEFLFSLMRGFY